MSAIFSPDRVYRYTLTRGLLQAPSLAVETTLELPRPDRTVLFVCLNPSTADEVKNDQTVSKCVGYAKRWGYDKLVVCNIFAFRARNPKRLYEVPDPVGASNDYYLQREAETADLIVCAWGTHGKLEGRLPRARGPRGEVVRSLLCDADVKLHVLGLNQDGSPKHPLYLRGDLEPEPWIPS